jgi:hypothetical protein
VLHSPKLGILSRTSVLGTFHTVLMLLLLCLIATHALWSEEAVGKPKSGDSAEAVPATAAGTAPYAGKWFLLFGGVNSHPRLEKASRLVDNQINHTFRLIAPGFDDVTTFADQRDDFMLWSPWFSVGRKLTTHLDVFLQAGYVEGEVESRASDTSIFLVPLHTDVRFHRSSLFLGTGFDWYPWGMAQKPLSGGLRECLKNTRPFMGLTQNWNYLTAGARVSAGFAPWPDMLRVRQDERWSTWNTGFFVGTETPVTSRLLVCTDFSYNLFYKYSDDFSGPSVSFYCKLLL